MSKFLERRFKPMFSGVCRIKGAYFHLGLRARTQNIMHIFAIDHLNIILKMAVPEAFFPIWYRWLVNVDGTLASSARSTNSL